MSENKKVTIRFWEDGTGNYYTYSSAHGNGLRVDQHGVVYNGDGEEMFNIKPHYYIDDVRIDTPHYMIDERIDKKIDERLDEKLKTKLIEKNYGNNYETGKMVTIRNLSNNPCTINFGEDWLVFQLRDMKELIAFNNFSNIGESSSTEKTVVVFQVKEYVSHETDISLEFLIDTGIIDKYLSYGFDCVIILNGGKDAYTSDKPIKEHILLNLNDYLMKQLASSSMFLTHANEYDNTNTSMMYDITKTKIFDIFGRKISQSEMERFVTLLFLSNEYQMNL